MTKFKALSVRITAAAQELGHTEIQPLHMLIGLLRGDQHSVVVRALGAAGITEARATELLLAKTPRALPHRQFLVPFSASASGAPRGTWLKAEALQQTAVEPEHVLLWLTTVPGPFADFGVDPEKLADNVRLLIADPDRRLNPAQSRWAARAVTAEDHRSDYQRGFEDGLAAATRGE